MLGSRSIGLIKLFAVSAILVLAAATFSVSINHQSHQSADSTLYIPAMSRFIVNSSDYIVIPFSTYSNGALTGSIVHNSSLVVMIYVPNTPSSAPDSRNLGAAGGLILNFSVAKGNYLLVMRGVPGETITVTRTIEVITCSV